MTDSKRQTRHDCRCAPGCCNPERRTAADERPATCPCGPDCPCGEGCPCAPECGC